MSKERKNSAAEESLCPEPEHYSRERTQALLGNAASSIRATFEGQSNIGFAGLAVETKNNALTIYWKDDVPAATERAIETIRGRGIQVSVIPARYTRAELLAEIRNLIEWEQLNVEPAHQAHTWIPMNDGSGIRIHVLKRNPHVEARRNASGMIRNTEEKPRAILLSDG